MTFVPGAAHAVATEQSPVEMRHAISALISVLRELADVVASVSRAQYTADDGVVPGTIGGHVRHILDHVVTLLAAADCAELNYDHRERGTPIETDPAAAIDLIRGLERQALRLDPSVLLHPLDIPVMVCGDGTAVRTRSTFGRELTFVMSHAIHHNALIAAMLKLMGLNVPSRFGYAPATVAHLDHVACAPSPSSH
jgi:uncharacterized damage-inducible protein DinB